MIESNTIWRAKKMDASRWERFSTVELKAMMNALTMDQHWTAIKGILLDQIRKEVAKRNNFCDANNTNFNLIFKNR